MHAPWASVSMRRCSPLRPRRARARDCTANRRWPQGDRLGPVAPARSNRLQIIGTNGAGPKLPVPRRRPYTSFLLVVNPLSALDANLACWRNLLARRTARRGETRKATGTLVLPVIGQEFSAFRPRQAACLACMIRAPA
jgi:hypothetical protein